MPHYILETTPESEVYVSQTGIDRKEHEAYSEDSSVIFTKEGSVICGLTLNGWGRKSSEDWVKAPVRKLLPFGLLTVLDKWFALRPDERPNTDDKYNEVITPSKRQLIVLRGTHDILRREPLWKVDGKNFMVHIEDFEDPSGHPVQPLAKVLCVEGSFSSMQNIRPVLVSEKGGTLTMADVMRTGTRTVIASRL